MVGLQSEPSIPWSRERGKWVVNGHTQYSQSRCSWLARQTRDPSANVAESRMIRLTLRCQPFSSCRLRFLFDSIQFATLQAQRHFDSPLRPIRTRPQLPTLGYPIPNPVCGIDSNLLIRSNPHTYSALLICFYSQTRPTVRCHRKPKSTFRRVVLCFLCRLNGITASQKGLS
jgi:hypothetical protein